MRTPEIGEILTCADGTKFFVEELTTAEDLEDGLDEADTPDPDFFLVTVVKGDNPDDFDPAADGIELDNTEFAKFCEDNSIRR